MGFPLPTAGSEVRKFLHTNFTYNTEFVINCQRVSGRLSMIATNSQLHVYSASYYGKKICQVICQNIIILAFTVLIYVLFTKVIQHFILI